MLERLLGARAAGEVADEDGTTSLLVAARGGHLEVLERLFGAGREHDAS